MQNLPWPLLPAFIGFAIAFALQFRLRNHIDREKVLRVQDMSQLDTPGAWVPRHVLTDRGKQLHGWMVVGIAVFLLGGLLATILR